MPYDSEGNFTRSFNWTEDAQNDINIEASRMDGEFNNFANGMNETFLRDGRSSMTNNIKMGNFKVTQLARGTVPTDAVNKGQLDEATGGSAEAIRNLLNKMFKIGDIKPSVRNENHDNWFLCNGQAINRVTYSNLFEIIGTKFGAGDGSTTFNLPDYRGKFLRGLGGDSESDIYKTQSESLPNITGSLDGVGTTSGASKSGALSNTSVGIQRFSASGSTSNHGWSTLKFRASDSSAIYSGTHVTPINQAVNYFIKVKEEK